jgi:hypothetical protein
MVDILRFEATTRSPLTLNVETTARVLVVARRLATDWTISPPPPQAKDCR